MGYKGLSEKQVFELRKKFGENIIPLKEKISWLSILFSQLKSPLIYILILVGLISLVFKEYFDAGLIGVVITVNVLMGFFQEYSAKNTLTALKNVLKPEAIVIRDGQRKKIEAKELVPGDLVVLGSGDKVPADGKLIGGVGILASEAILTGEEEAVVKNTNEKSNLVYMGTIVLSGSGIMEVTKVGVESEIGKIGKGIAEMQEEKTPLQVKLEIFAKQLSMAVLGICVCIFIFGVFRGEDPVAMFRMAVILSIAAIPEGLPIAITMILALGMRKILKKNGLVKTLLSIETLGSTSVICTDKTGTLTEGKMKVVKTNFSDKDKTLIALTVNNEQRSSLEVALWEYVKNEIQADPQEIFDQTERIYQEPFDSGKKYSMTINRVQGKENAFLMGAPEVVLSFCRISQSDKKNILEECEKWAEEGLRILGVSFKEDGALRETKEFSWLGLIGIADPVRKEVKEAVITAQKAGIAIKIVTGDYRKTAERVAAVLGFTLEPKNIMEGEELEAISENALKEKIDHILLFTRVTPQHKLKIVKVLQEKGEIVAMTGDGVNDAPALKKANIGVAVGNASDVAKEASDLILLDSNFTTIIDVIKEGRLVFTNIKKTVGYVLSNSFAEIVLIFGAIIMGYPPPLLVVQILWVHLICDGPIDLSLAFEPKEHSLMLISPQEIQKEGILTGETKSLIFIVSITAGILSLLLFWSFGLYGGNIHLGRTVAFATIAIVSLVYVFSYKNLKKSIITTEKFSRNIFMFLAVFLGLALVFLAVYIPFLNTVLGTVPLKPLHWVLIVSVAFFTMLVVELVKFFSNNTKTSHLVIK